MSDKSHEKGVFGNAPQAKKKTPNNNAKSDWVSLRPIPEDAPNAPEVHSLLKKPSVIYTYKNEESQLLGYIYRFETTDKTGKKAKEFRPLTFREHQKTKVRKWGFYGWENPRPLYGLDLLAKHPNAIVLICEGEKAADAARTVVDPDDYAVITSSNGAASAKKADWSMVFGRPVCIWPDHDEGGIKYALAVVQLLLKHNPDFDNIEIVSIPDDKPKKWDAADAVAEGLSGQDFYDFLENSMTATTFLAEYGGQHREAGAEDVTGGDGASNDSKNGGGGRINKTAELIEISECCEFWHDDDEVPYVSAPVERNGNFYIEHMKIGEKKFRRWLAGRYFFKKDGRGVVSEKNIGEALLVLSAKALYQGKMYQTYNRIYQKNSEIWIDLINESRDTVHITPSGWSIVASEKCPIKFIRAKLLRALPLPETAAVLDDHLRDMINAGSEEDYKMIVAWLLGCFHTEGPMPLLSLTGTTGSGKSGLHKMLIQIIDPQKAAGRRLPEDVRVLSIVAAKTHLMMFDNIKSIPAWLSDDLSSLTTGGGFVTRVLTTDDDILALDIRRPIIMNGIGGIGGQADLISRGIAVEIPKLVSRKTESKLRAEFEEKLPFILGGLYNALSAGLKNFDDDDRDDDPEIRMFDFYRWVVSCQNGLGWDDGDFKDAYQGNIKKSFHRVVDVEPVAAAIVRYIDEPFTGISSKLLDFLNSKIPESKRRNRAWPKTAAAMGTAVKRVSSALSQGGYEISRGTGRKEREITIKPPKNPEYALSESEKIEDEMNNFD